MSEQYDPHNYDELYAPQYGGFGESRGGGGYGSGDRYRPMGGNGRMMGGPRGSSRGRSGNRQRGGSSNSSKTIDSDISLCFHGDRGD